MRTEQSPSGFLPTVRNGGRGTRLSKPVCVIMSWALDETVFRSAIRTISRESRSSS